MERMLSVRNLRVWFPVRRGILGALRGGGPKYVRAVDGIDFDIHRGEVFCLVGESGCGKTTTGKAVLRLLAPTSGRMLFAVNPEDEARYRAIQKRLRELQPVLKQLMPADRARAERARSKLQRLRRKLARAEKAVALPRMERRRRRLERAAATLEERKRALEQGTDRGIQRRLAKALRRLELLRTMGPWFTPRRAKRLDRWEKELAEARFRQMRAEAVGARAGKYIRRARRLERKIQGMKAHVGPAPPQSLMDLEARIAKRRQILTERESREVEAGLSGLRERLRRLEEAGHAQGRVRTLPGAIAALLENLEARIAKRRMPTAGEPGEAEAGLSRIWKRLRRLQEAMSGRAEERVRTLQQAIAALVERGGPALEASDLQAQVDEFLERYDLASWGKKGRGRRGRARREVKRKMRQLRRRAQMIFQDPYESLNPKLSVFDTVAEPLLANRIVSTLSEAEPIVARALEDVGLKPAAEFMFRFPHELSGGQRQRVGIAAALVVDPEFLVADEPVSMLDASVRTEILALLLDLKKLRNLTYLFITHDLGLAWIIADRIAVMYLGKIVETGNAAEIIRNPRHPYTKALISVVPSPNPSVRREKIILRGERPNPVDIPPGCRFHPRCPAAVGMCGWDAEEVRQELERLLAEDRKGDPRAQAIERLASEGSLTVRVATRRPADVAEYLRTRVETLRTSRAPLGAIRRIRPEAEAVRVDLHNPKEPALRRIREDVWVACHLVEPEIPQAIPAAAAK